MAYQIKNACFFHIPKTGGTWVREVLRPLPGREVGSVHASPGQIAAPACGLSFAFVRSPWTWYPSMFAYKLRTDPDYRKLPSLRAAVGGVQTFAEFMDGMLSVYPGHLSHRYRCYMSCDRIGRTESLSADLPRFLEEAGHRGRLVLPRRRVNVSRGPRPQWESRHIDQIRETESWIFETFQYPESP